MQHTVLGAAAVDTAGLGFSNLPSFLWTFVEYYGLFVVTLMATINAIVYGTKDNY